MNERATWMANGKAPMPVRKGGGTLVEVMIGCLLLAIIVIAGMEYLVRTQSAIFQHRDRQIAIEKVNSSLETIRGTSYSILTNGLALTYGTNTTVVNGVTKSIWYFDADGVGNSFDGLQIMVSAGLGKGADPVVLRTRVAP